MGYTTKSCGKAHAHCRKCKTIKRTPHKAGCTCSFHSGQWGISYKHPEGCMCAAHGGHKRDYYLTSLEDLLQRKLRRDGDGQRIKKRLIEAGVKEDLCEECGQDSTWNGKPITLQLDHIDGDRTNWALENLRIICPNCHTQTRNWCGKRRDTGSVREKVEP